MIKAVVKFNIKGEGVLTVYGNTHEEIKQMVENAILDELWINELEIGDIKDTAITEEEGVLIEGHNGRKILKES